VKVDLRRCTAIETLETDAVATGAVVAATVAIVAAVVRMVRIAAAAANLD
jgi:hypothetical protein